MRQQNPTARYLPGKAGPKVRKAYTTPSVKFFGTLRELTKSGSGSKLEVSFRLGHRP